MLRSIPCHSDKELRQLLEGDRESLKELARYNGTPQGANAINDVKRHMEMVEREIARRENGENL